MCCTSPRGEQKPTMALLRCFLHDLQFAQAVSYHTIPQGACHTAAQVFSYVRYCCCTVEGKTPVPNWRPEINAMEKHTHTAVTHAQYSSTFSMDQDTAAFFVDAAAPALCSENHTSSDSYGPSLLLVNLGRLIVRQRLTYVMCPPHRARAEDAAF